MRIAIISEVFLPKIDGVVNRTLNLIRQLPRFSDDLLIICPQAQGCTECPVPVVSVPSFSFPLYPEYRIGLPDQALAETLKRFAPDVRNFSFLLKSRAADWLSGSYTGKHDDGASRD